MSDWFGLGVIILILTAGLFALAHLGRPPQQLTQDEFERRVKASQGWMSAGVAGGMYALQKLMNPKAAEAVEIQKDLRAGYYDDQRETGEGDESTGGESPTGSKDETDSTDEEDV